MPESLLCAVGTKLDNLNLSLLPDMPVAQMVNHFQSILSNLLVETFMEKQITLCSDDLPYFNENLSEAQIHKENLTESYWRETGQWLPSPEET